ncbi:MAG: hypothetical protein ACXVI5_06595 [Halobacteriota archaeon]
MCGGTGPFGDESIATLQCSLYRCDNCGHQFKGIRTTTCPECGSDEIELKPE